MKALGGACPSHDEPQHVLSELDFCPLTKWVKPEHSIPTCLFFSNNVVFIIFYKRPWLIQFCWWPQKIMTALACMTVPIQTLENSTLVSHEFKHYILWCIFYDLSLSTTVVSPKHCNLYSNLNSSQRPTEWPPVFQGQKCREWTDVPHSCTYTHSGCHEDWPWLQIAPWGDQGSGWDQRTRLSSFRINSPPNTLFSHTYAVSSNPSLLSQHCYHTTLFIHSALSKVGGLKVKIKNRHAQTCNQKQTKSDSRDGETSVHFLFCSNTEC